MVVIFSKNNNTFEVKYDMIEKPVRMRASNAVRRWELLQLEDQTQDMYEELIQELQDVLDLDLSPVGVEKLSATYASLDPESCQVGMVLHKDHKKMKELSLYHFININTRLELQCILLELDILTKSTIKMEITLYINTV